MQKFVWLSQKKELLKKFQFGFRKEHSTVHPMVHFMNKITNALKNKLLTIAIFCDLRKAFDSCNHNILLNKLRGLGLSGTTLVRKLPKKPKNNLYFSMDLTVLLHPWSPLIFNLYKQLAWCLRFTYTTFCGRYYSFV